MNVQFVAGYMCLFLDTVKSIVNLKALNKYFDQL